MDRDCVDFCHGIHRVWLPLCNLCWKAEMGTRRCFGAIAIFVKHEKLVRSKNQKQSQLH